MQRVLFLALVLSLPAYAQDAGPDAGAGAGQDAGPTLDAGVVDAGAPTPDAGQDPCAPRCEGTTLHFCDGVDPVTRDCADEGAICGELSAAWGFDCLLPEGASCEPGYGDDLSNCEGASAGVRCCVNNLCESQGTPADCTTFAPGRPEVPEAPTDGPIAPPDPNVAAGCLDCQNANAAWLIPLLLLRPRRRR